jgi:hypothetical protein
MLVIAGAFAFAWMFGTAGVVTVAGTSLNVAVMAGAMIGSYLDSAYLFPTLFPPPEVKGPRVSDFEFSGFDEGQSANFPLGKEVRVPGNTIWCSNLIEDKSTQGGKGGGGGEYIEYKYFVHCAVLWANKLIEKVSYIFANEKMLFTETGDVEYGPGGFTVDITRKTSAMYDTATASYIYHHDIDITAEITGPDLTVFVGGRDLEVSGAASGGNNGTWPCIKSGTRDNTGETYVRVRLAENSASPTHPGTENLNQTNVRLYQKIPQWSKKSVVDIKHYIGTVDQLPDPLIESKVGAGETSAYRNRAYSVFKRLALINYGNHLPHSWIAQLVEKSNSTLDHPFRELCRAAKYSDAEIDVSALVDREFFGFNVKGLVVGKAALQPLQLAYDVIGRPEGSKMVFRFRSDMPTRTVDSDHLGATDVEGPDPTRSPFPCLMTKKPDRVTPTRVYVTAMEQGWLGQLTTQAGRRFSGQLGQRVEVIDLPIILDKDDVRNIAERVLWSTNTTQVHFRLGLPPSYIDVLEGDQVVFTFEGRPCIIQAQKVEIGANFQVFVEGPLEEIETLTHSRTAEDNFPG